MGTRAEKLAERIEQGAAELAKFAEGISDADWKKRMPDGRTVGVVVHHVASMYPIEVAAADTVAGGAPFTAPWEAVHEINAKHAKEFADVSKADALALLRKNSKEAAAAIRKYTDAQLDFAAPFELCYGAPMTTQFVVEDHALRHPWHHLARIKKTLGR